MTSEKIPEAKWQETMILASIIESEAGSDADRKKVARVFLNRLDEPTAETVGLLQSDATVSYGIGQAARGRADPGGDRRCRQPVQHPDAQGAAADPDLQPGQGRRSMPPSTRPRVTGSTS